jgi:hypothetical protein
MMRTLSLSLLVASLTAPLFAAPLRTTAMRQPVDVDRLRQLEPSGGAGKGGGGGGGTGGGTLTCDVEYFGGRLIQNVEIFAVYWTDQAPNGTPEQYDAYFSTIVQSSYFDWIREWDTGTPYKLGRGSYLGHYIDMAPPQASATTLQDADIHTWLSGLIAANKIPAPDDNTLYVTFFPGTITINNGGQTSCQVFCAYHGGYADSGSGKHIQYAVMPDVQCPGSSGPGGCGQGTGFQNMTSTASHEIMEAITDPEVWAATGSSTKSLGWYDQADQSSGGLGGGGTCQGGGEVGDICNQQTALVGTYTVQTIWSDKQNKCVAGDSTVTVADFSLALDNAAPGAPVGGTATAKVTSTPVGTMTATLNLVASGLPTGVTAAFAPASVMTNASSAVTFTVAAGTAPGSYPFTVTGNTALPDNVIHSVTGTLTVSPPPPPDMATPPDLSPSSSGNGTGGNGANTPPGVGNTASGCSIGGDAVGGAWLLAVAFALVVGRRRRRA